MRYVKIPVPLVPPLGWEVTNPELIDELIDMYFPPDKLMSVEERGLYGILMAVKAGLIEGVKED